MSEYTFSGHQNGTSVGRNGLSVTDHESILKVAPLTQQPRGFERFAQPLEAGRERRFWQGPVPHAGGVHATRARFVPPVVQLPDLDGVEKVRTLEAGSDGQDSMQRRQEEIASLQDALKAPPKRAVLLVACTERIYL